MYKDDVELIRPRSEYFELEAEYMEKLQVLLHNYVEGTGIINFFIELANDQANNMMLDDMVVFRTILNLSENPEYRTESLHFFESFFRNRINLKFDNSLLCDFIGYVDHMLTNIENSDQLTLCSLLISHLISLGNIFPKIFLDMNIFERLVCLWGGINIKDLKWKDACRSIMISVGNIIKRDIFHAYMANMGLEYSKKLIMHIIVNACDSYNKGTSQEFLNIFVNGICLPICNEDFAQEGLVRTIAKFLTSSNNRFLSIKYLYHAVQYSPIAVAKCGILEMSPCDWEYAEIEMSSKIMEKMVYCGIELIPLIVGSTMYQYITSNIFIFPYKIRFIISGLYVSLIDNMDHIKISPADLKIISQVMCLSISSTNNCTRIFNTLMKLAILVEFDHNLIDIISDIAYDYENCLSHEAQILLHQLNIKFSP